MLFSFFIITGFFVSIIRHQSTNIFFSLIFPLFFHFDGPFPLKIDIELMLFKLLHPKVILKNNKTVLPDHIGITKQKYKHINKV